MPKFAPGNPLIPLLPVSPIELPLVENIEDIALGLCRASNRYKGAEMLGALESVTPGAETAAFHALFEIDLPHGPLLIGTIRGKWFSFTPSGENGGLLEPL